MIVVISAEAEADLEAIGDYIARDNAPRALTFVQALRAKCLGLADRPLAYPLIERHEVRGVRKRTHGQYLIFCRITGETILVAHVVHGAMDYAKLLD